MGFFPHLQFACRRFFRRARNQAMDLNRRDAVKFGSESARPESKHAVEYDQQNRLESERLRAAGG
jgi:hypothetical protein